jgi:D-alanine-D-alanine ligase-like ATP-grasp enzyme
LRHAGRIVTVARYRDAVPPPALLLLRLSDPVMRRAARLLGESGASYFGPSTTSLELCYDKWTASRLVAESGIACPESRLATNADSLRRPIVLKPRRGSDSIGLRFVDKGRIPRLARNDHTLAQTRIIGPEFTVGVINGVAGLPLRLLLPEGTPYTFVRKYLLRPAREALTEAPEVREAALHVASVVKANWAVRVDFMLERGSKRLMFLECDAAPLVGPNSAFAESLAAAGMARCEQLSHLLGGR